MEIAEYLRVLLRRWRWVAALAALGVLAAYAYASVQRPTYDATAELFVSVRGDASTATDLQQGNTFTTQRMSSYTEVASGPLVTEPVISRLGLEMSAEELGDRITAVSPVDTVLIKLTVEDSRPDRAARLANACAEQLTQVIAELERPSRGGSRSPVRATITRPASPPEAPVSPDTRRLIVLGLLAGLAVGVAAALYREMTDRSVKDHQGLEAASGAPVLGSIGIDSDRIRGDATAPDVLHREDPRAEAYRQLRTALTFANVDHPLASVLVTSAAPAEGKTTTVINLATVIAQTDSRVCVVDADMRRSTLPKPLGLVADVGLTNVLIGAMGLDEALQNSPTGFDVLAAGPPPPNPSELLGTERMEKLLAELKSRYDLVLFDTPPVGPVTDAAVLASAVDGVLIVARSGTATHDSVALAVRTLERVNARVLGTVLNMAPRSSGYGSYGGYQAQVDERRTRRTRRSAAGKSRRAGR